MFADMDYDVIWDDYFEQTWPCIGNEHVPF